MFDTSMPDAVPQGVGGIGGRRPNCCQGVLILKACFRVSQNGQKTRVTVQPGGIRAEAT